MRRLWDAPHGIRVNRWKGRLYEQYTRQDYPMGNAENISQYYKALYMASKMTPIY